MIKEIVKNLKCRFGLHDYETVDINQLANNWGVEAPKVTIYLINKDGNYEDSEDKDPLVYNVCRNCGEGDPFLTGEF